MAWRCHGHNNTSLVSALAEHSIIRSKVIADAMLAVDRGLFVPPQAQTWAYQDAPQPIGYDATISAPHMHAYALELLINHLKPGNKALDVGSGSGYLCAVMARLVCPPDDTQCGKVVGIEHVPELVTNSIQAVKTIPWAQEMLNQGRIVLKMGDGRQGYAPAAPYHAIHVGAAAPHVPAALTSQLAPGGRMVIPVGPQGGPQHLMVLDKSLDGHTITESNAMGVIYVPLTDRQPHYV